MNTEKPEDKQAPPSARQRCVYCAAPLQIVWVHGHGQCAHCGINVDPCCGGAPGESCEIREP